MTESPRSGRYELLMHAYPQLERIFFKSVKD